MNVVLSLILVAVFSYLLGSVNFAIIVSKLLAKDDVRNHFSGNAGMTNMLRTYGKWPAVLTAVGDCGKGALAVFLARVFVPQEIPVGVLGNLDPGYIAAIFVLVGHIFPVFFGFKGGKGVMATIGILLVLDPVVCFGLLIVVIPIMLISRYMSLASLVGIILLPIFTCIYRLLQQQRPWCDVICCCVMTVLVVYVHRGNIQRLKNGTENKIGSKKKEGVSSRES